MIPTLPDGRTLMLEKAMRIAALIEAEVAGKPEAPPGTVFLTSSEYGQLMREIKAKAGGLIPAAFYEAKHFLVGRVTFRNAGTDNAAAVLEANRRYEEQSGFLWKRLNLQTGRA